MSRAYLYENYPYPDISPGSHIRFEWTAPGIQSHDPGIEAGLYQSQAPGNYRWNELLSIGKSITGIVNEFPDREKAFLERLGILSLVQVPIFVGGNFWGYMGFDDCLTLRNWSSVEIDALEAAASLFGEGIQRQ